MACRYCPVTALGYSGGGEVSKDAVLDKRDFALLAAFAVEGRARLAWMIHVIIDADVIAEDFLTKPT